MTKMISPSCILPSLTRTFVDYFQDCLCSPDSFLIHLFVVYVFLIWPIPTVHLIYHSFIRKMRDILRREMAGQTNVPGLNTGGEGITPIDVRTTTTV
jgi:hypothetical protein